VTKHPTHEEFESQSRPGTRLADLIARAPLDDAALYALARDLAEAIAHAHERGHSIGPIGVETVTRSGDSRWNVAKPTTANSIAPSRADDIFAFGRLLTESSTRGDGSQVPAWLARVVDRCHPAHPSPYRRGADVVAALLPLAFRFVAKQDGEHSASSGEFSDDSSAMPMPMRRAAWLSAVLTTVIGIAAVVVRDDTPPPEVERPRVRATPERITTPKKKKVKQPATVVDATPDTTAPVVTFTATDGSALESRFAVDGASFVFTIAATDDRGVESATQRVTSPDGSVRAEAVSPMSLRRGTSVEIPLAARGEHAIELEVRDAAGNVASATLVIDRR
jgi:hypothetical protein